MKKEKTYWIYVPVKETWVFTVKASSKKEALERYLKNHESLEQNSSQGGWPKGNRGQPTSKIQVEGD